MCLRNVSGWIMAVVFPAAIAAAESPVTDSGLHNLYRLRDARSRRVSSADDNWKDGNGDARSMPPGQTLTLADVRGPGIIRHIWFTIYADDPAYHRSLVLRMYWDDATEPGVESPLGDFFGNGHGERRRFGSLPVTITSDAKAYNCYWPMPFAKRARITLTNDSKTLGAGAFWYVDYEEVPSLPPDSAYFYAQYRQEYPARPGNYLLLDAVGRGHYVGTVLSAQFRTQGWFGEGDDLFFIDGEAEPSLRGTGTEDYFCDAWGFRVFDRPFNGVTMLDGFQVGDRVTAYRWHVHDPVHFRKSLRVEIEHKGEMWDTANKRISGFYERPDLFSSVAYWYQTPPAKRFAELPPLEERVIHTTTIEAETLANNAKAEGAGAVVSTQQGSWSGGAQLFALFQSTPASLTVPFRVEKETDGILRLKLTRSWDYGVWSVALDGKVMPGMQSVDLYSANTQADVFRGGYMMLAEGPHELRFECVGKNERSKGYFLGVDAITIEDIKPFYASVAEKKD